MTYSTMLTIDNVTKQTNKQTITERERERKRERERIKKILLKNPKSSST